MSYNLIFIPLSRSSQDSSAYPCPIPSPNEFPIIKLQKLLVIYDSMYYLIFIQIIFNKINLNKTILNN